MKKVCDYCKTNTAVKYFATARKWCCDEIVYRCPAVKERLYNKRFYNTKTSIMRRKLNSGKEVCIYCGLPAKHISSRFEFVCSKPIWGCSVWNSMFRKKRKQLYIDNPEYREKQKKVGKEVHNRKEVKDKKRNSMVQLHRGRTRKAVEFRKKYKRGIEGRKNNHKVEIYEYLSARGFDEQYLSSLRYDKLKLLAIETRRKFNEKYNRSK